MDTEHEDLDDDYEDGFYNDEPEPLNLSIEELLALEKEKTSLKRKEVKDTNAQDLRTQILAHGIPMIETIQEQLYNGRELKQSQLFAINTLLPIVTDLIKQTSDLQKIEAKNASEVIGLVAQGKISLTDASKFMALMQTKVEMEELPKLLEKISELEEK